MSSKFFLTGSYYLNGAHVVRNLNVLCVQHLSYHLDLYSPPSKVRTTAPVVNVPLTLENANLIDLLNTQQTGLYDRVQTIKKMIQTLESMNDADKNTAILLYFPNQKKITTTTIL